MVSNPLSPWLIASVLAADLLGGVAVGAEPRFERIGRESGPPPAVITALLQDRAGFIWVGSRAGLFVYDGHEFREFEHDPGDVMSISDSAIRTIHQDSAGTLWVGTNAGGLNRLDRAKGTFEHFRHGNDPTTLSHDSVYAILEDRDGDLWVGTQQGLNRLDRTAGTFERFMAGDDETSMRHDYVTSLYEDRDGILWVGTLGGGLTARHPTTGVFTTYRADGEDPSALGDDQVLALAGDSDGALWIGTLHGLGRRAPDGTFTHHDETSDDVAMRLRYQLATSIAVDRDDHVWVGTYGGGLHEIDPATGQMHRWHHEPGTVESRTADTIAAVLIDESDAIWTGTWGGGLNRVSRMALFLTPYMEAATGLVDDRTANVTSLGLDSAGGLWLGTRPGVVLRRDPATNRGERLLQLGQIVLAVVEDKRGRIWIGTNGGLHRFDPAARKTVAYVHDPADDASIGPGYVRAVLRDRDDRIWIGTGEGGVQQIEAEGRVVRRFTHDPDDAATLSDDYVTVLFEDRAGILWVGTRSAGLNALDRATGRVERFRPAADDPTSLSHYLVTAIHEDARGRLWIATGGGGLNRAARGDDGRMRFARIGLEHGLADMDVLAILEDDDGSLWLSTKRGLSRCEPEREVCVNLYVADGLPTSEFEPGAAVRGPDGLWFGSVKGPVTIPAGSPFPSRRPSPTRVTSIRTSTGEVSGDRPVWELEEIAVPYGGRLSIELATLDFQPGIGGQYAYRLDDEWVELAGREIDIANLSPGSHVFTGRGRNSQGVWSETAPLAIEVVPPVWMTTWFRASAIALLLIGGIIGHRFRVAAVERRNAELERLHTEREKAQRELGVAYERLRRLTRRLDAAKENERKVIARELHDELGQTLSAVRINVQLLRKGIAPDAAPQRLDDTAELVDRMIQRVGNLSLDLRPPLLDDLGLVSTLRGYLAARARRAGIEIELTGAIAAGSLPPEIEINGFRVVQEAVTNALRHADARRIDVDVRRDDGRLILSVRDDGRGFDVEQVLRRAVEGNHLGLLGMQERARGLGGEVEYRSTRDAGTEIRVSLPLRGAT